MLAAKESGTSGHSKLLHIPKSPMRPRGSTAMVPQLEGRRCYSMTSRMYATMRCLLELLALGGHGGQEPLLWLKHRLDYA